MDPNQHFNALNKDDKLHWYEIISILGQGGFGITYLARDTNLDRLFAIKEYLPTEFSTRDKASTVQPISEKHTEVFEWGKKRFLDEARTLAQFDHPNIVRVHSFFENNNTGYMVMDYEQGKDLSEIIKAGASFDEKRLLEIVLPILDGLELVHDQGFIHRDIKPPNVFIREDGSPVLIDFGSARQAIGGQTRTMTSLVTPGYAPFEQYHDADGKQGPWTDIYSLGATLYCAITSKPPIESLKRGLARVEHNTDAYLKLTDLCADKYSLPFLEAIDLALQFSINDRPDSLSIWKKMLLGEIQMPGLVHVAGSNDVTKVNKVSPEATIAATIPATKNATKTQSIEETVVDSGGKVGTSIPTDSESTPPTTKSGLSIVKIVVAMVVPLLLIVFLWLQPEKSEPLVVASDSVDKNQVVIEKLQSELDEKNALLKQAEAERVAEAKNLAEQEKQKILAAQQELIRQQQAEQKKQDDIARKKVELKIQQQESEKRAAREALRKQEAEKKKLQLARQKLEKENLVKLAEDAALNQQSLDQAETIPPESINYTGAYSSEITYDRESQNLKRWVFGNKLQMNVQLTQRGNAITGNFIGDRSGDIEGEINAEGIYFKWYVTKGGNNASGSAELKLESGGVLIGRWEARVGQATGNWILNPE